MDDDEIDDLIETHELAFFINAKGNLEPYDSDRWHAVVMRQESELRFADTTQQFIHVYFREAQNGGYSVEGLDVGEYEFLSDGCRKGTPEDIIMKMALMEAVQSVVGEEPGLEDPNVIRAENSFANHAISQSSEIWEPSDDQMEQMEFWITMFFEAAEECES